MGTEASLDTLKTLVPGLVGFVVCVTAVYLAWPETLEWAIALKEAVIETVLSILGMQVRGCDRDSVISIQALKTGLDCAAYIHAHEKCFHLDTDGVDEFEKNDGTWYHLDRFGTLPRDIKRIKFHLEDTGKVYAPGGGPSWYLDYFEVKAVGSEFFQIDQKHFTFIFEKIKSLGLFGL